VCVCVCVCVCCCGCVSLSGCALVLPYRLCVTWLIHICATTHAYVWNDSNTLVHFSRCAYFQLKIFKGFTAAEVYVTKAAAQNSTWHDSFICAAVRIHTCDTTHSFVRHDPFICATVLIHTSDMTHVYIHTHTHTHINTYTHTGFTAAEAQAHVTKAAARNLARWYVENSATDGLRFEEVRFVVSVCRISQPSVAT